MSKNMTDDDFNKIPSIVDDIKLVDNNLLNIASKHQKDEYGRSTARDFITDYLKNIGATNVPPEVFEALVAKQEQVEKKWVDDIKLSEPTSAKVVDVSDEEFKNAISNRMDEYRQEYIKSYHNTGSDIKSDTAIGEVYKTGHSKIKVDRPVDVNELELPEITEVLKKEFDEFTKKW